MTITNKKDLMRMIDASTEDLHQKIDRHKYLMATILDQKVNDKALKRIGSVTGDTNRLKRAIEEAIEVLERTRRSFKSKQLQALRERLIQVLVES